MLACGASHPIGDLNTHPTTTVILEVKAARAWSLTQTADAFLVTPDTIASWLKRIDEAGPTRSCKRASR